MSRQPYSRADRNRAGRNRLPRSRFGRPVVPGMSWREGGMVMMAVGPTSSYDFGPPSLDGARRTIVYNAAAGTPVGTLTVNGAASPVFVGPCETVRFHGRKREDGTLEWVADKTVVEPEEGE